MQESDIVTKVKNERIARGRNYRDYFTPMQWKALKRGAGFSATQAPSRRNKRRKTI